MSFLVTVDWIFGHADVGAGSAVSLPTSSGGRARPLRRDRADSQSCASPSRAQVLFCASPTAPCPAHGHNAMSRMAWTLPRRGLCSNDVASSARGGGDLLIPGLHWLLCLPRPPAPGFICRPLLLTMSVSLIFLPTWKVILALRGTAVTCQLPSCLFPKSRSPHLSPKSFFLGLCSQSLASRPEATVPGLSPGPCSVGEVTPAPGALARASDPAASFCASAPGWEPAVPTVLGIGRHGGDKGRGVAAVHPTHHSHRLLCEPLCVVAPTRAPHA